MPHIPDSHHDTHDLELVAAFAAGDAEGAALERATALVASCPGCAALHHDLRSIVAAMPELPAPIRSRDFRLTPEQAASLRPAGFRGLLAAFSGPRFAFATPVGTGLAALGIVGVLVASGGFATGGATGGGATVPEVGTEMITMPAPAGREGASDAVSGLPAGSPAVGTPPAGVPAVSAAPSAGVDTMGGTAPSTAAPSGSPAADDPKVPSASASDEHLANIAPSPAASEAAPGAAAIDPTPTAPATKALDRPLADPVGEVQSLAVALGLLALGLALVSLRWVAGRAA